MSTRPARGRKIALVTGIAGQDGAYLAQLLLSKGYAVYGTYRTTSSARFWRLEELGIKDDTNLQLEPYDLTDLGATLSLIDRLRPDEIYNFAAQSFVGTSFEQPTTTAQVTALGALNLLESIRLVSRNSRYYQASTSEMFGRVQSEPQVETTQFYPRSPYGVAKLYAHWMTVNYRESHGIFGVSGILFNHESPLRGPEMVTRKITDGVARIKLGRLDTIELGNLDARRDWGYAREYVEGMYRMLQADEPDTFVLATGRALTVRDFVTFAFAAAGMDLEWSGTGLDEVGRETQGGKVVVRVNPVFYRPPEAHTLVGNPAKAQRKLGWSARTQVEEMCRLMLEEDLRRNVAGPRP
jgi:GDPmannose 4,6-dehydratase